MKANDANGRNDLNKIIDQKLTSLIREMEDADWRAEEVVLAIDCSIKTHWLERLEALQAARDATPANFVSDGNEG